MHSGVTVLPVLLVAASPRCVIRAEDAAAGSRPSLRLGHGGYKVTVLLAALVARMTRSLGGFRGLSHEPEGACQ